MTRREASSCAWLPRRAGGLPVSRRYGRPKRMGRAAPRAGAKAFAFIFRKQGGLCVNKMRADAGDFLRKVYPGVQPAYHMNKQHWNSVYPDRFASRMRARCWMTVTG